VSAISAAVGVRLDPINSYNFLVMLVDSGGGTAFGAVKALLSPALGGFTECSGLTTSIETEDYRQGGQNDRVLHFPTRITYENIRLSHGVGLLDELWNWHHGFVTGKGTRKDGVIVLQDDHHIPLKAWIFRRGIPIQLVGPTLNASQSLVAIEQVTIQHEGLDLVSPGTALAAAQSAIGVG
jgi:phage tail-like protein